MKNFHDKIIANVIRKSIEVSILRAKLQKESQHVSFHSKKVFSEIAIARIWWGMISMIDTLLFMNILFGISYFFDNLHWKLPFDVLSLKPQGVSILIIFGIPTTFNYFTILFNKRYKKLLNKYDGNNGTLFLKYLFFVMGSIVLQIGIVILVYVLGI